PPDPQAAAFPVEAASFAAVPRAPLPFPALVVASSDDPYADLTYAQTLAADWGAGFVEAGALGHINAASGVGAWTQGRDLLTAFRAGLGVA
ncbi:MAG TPA: alpha/beta hydrolase, partial [Azospirillaceae bacterium]|nr:alpha/beta hydrolase [Azospirillaceae bacterium]